MNRNYSDAYDPDMTAAEYHGWPSREEAEAVVRAALNGREWEVVEG